MDAPAFTGVTRVYQLGDDLAVRLYRFRDAGSTLTTDDNLELFAECPIHLEKDDALSKFVDEVVDSSRYFVLRCKDRNSNRVAMVGIGGCFRQSGCWPASVRHCVSNLSPLVLGCSTGFRERQTATDFRGVLLDHVKFLRRQATALTGAHEGEGDEGDAEGVGGGGVSAAPAVPTVDLSLHEGQKIRINLKNRRKPDDTASSGSSTTTRAASSSSSSATGGSGTAFGLRPPPPAPAPELNEDDWGDFETA